MLTRVQISNINAIDFCDIDFQKGKYKYLDNMIYQDRLVNPIAFYGSNGSGKSSFLKVFLHLLRLLTSEPQNVIPFRINRFYAIRQIHELDKEFKKNESKSLTDDEINELLISMPSSVKLFFELNLNEYEYYIETTLRGCITKENLFVNGTQIFERDINSYRYKEKNNQIDESLYPSLRKIATDNQEDEHITGAYNFLSGIGYIDAVKQDSFFRDFVERDYRDIIVEKSSMVKNILSQYREFPSYDFVSKLSDDGKKEYYIQLEADDCHVTIPYYLMSSGMYSQSVLLSTLLSLPQNGVLFVDEIEDALHPITILDFIKVVQERNIQLIFSSHNTFLLQKLRPDQIIFANWKNGYSTYKKLSDIYPNIREINNIEKMYFANMFDEEIKNG